MVTSSTLPLDEILTKRPEEIQQIYHQDLEILRDGSEAQKREVAKRHMLSVLPIDTKEAVNKSVLKALRHQIRKGSIDGVALEDVRDIETAPSFEVLRYDPTGMNLTDRGFLIVANKVLKNGVVKIFYNVFHDDERRKRAVAGQEFTAGLTDYVRGTVTDVEVLDLLGSFQPVRPVYSKKNIMANVFLDSDTLHETFKISTTDEKYEHLKKTALLDLVMSHYSKDFLQTRKGKKLLKQFMPVKHGLPLIQGALSRCDPALKNIEISEKELELQGEKAFSHGDGLPSNMMLNLRQFRPQAAEMLGQNGISTYTPIDFEFACMDYPEATIVQRLVKSGSYDFRGDSLALSNGITVEEQLLEDAGSFMSKLDPNFNEQEMQERFGKLKAENYLLWAVRYRGIANAPSVKNPEDSKLLSQYFYTLFEKEAANQGLQELLDYAQPLFGEPLSEEQMRAVFEQHNPEARGFSVLKTNIPIDAEKKLERLVKDYNKKQLRGVLRKGALAATVLLTIVGGALFGINQYNTNEDLAEQVQKIEKQKEYEAKIKFVQLYQTGGRFGGENMQAINELSIIHAWNEKFPDNKEFAYAAYLDYEVLHRSLKEYKQDRGEDATSMIAMAGHLPEDYWHALLQTVDTLDRRFSPEKYRIPTHPSWDPDYKAKATVEKIMETAEENYERQKTEEADKKLREFQRSKY